MQLAVDIAKLGSKDALQRIDDLFLEFLKNSNKPNLATQIIELRLEKKEATSDQIIAIAQILEIFLSKIFGIEQDIAKAKNSLAEISLIIEARKQFVERYALCGLTDDEINKFDTIKAEKNLAKILGVNFTQLSLAKASLTWLQDQEKFKKQLRAASIYTAAKVHASSTDLLFQVPQKNNDLADFLKSNRRQNYYKNYNRYDFDFDGRELAQCKAQSEANYCIYCHKRSKDSCRTGLKIQKDYKNGCPLDQKISQMHYLKSLGLDIAALSVIMMDNPMVALTGHRICYDCSNACIFQNQDAVDTPMVESQILKAVLSLPYGAEIYMLLLNWNPLKHLSYLPSDNNDKKILIAGLGPAGIAAAHYLSHSGHHVEAIDAVSISALNFDISAPIKNWSTVTKNLSRRPAYGFGGVSEYGVTPRWDKNMLTLVRVALQRRSNIYMHGGCALGANITVNQALQAGFDHVVIATGAHAPKTVNIPGAAAKGVHLGVDFLMRLQWDSHKGAKGSYNFVLAPPLIVIGGGLTAIDTALEALNYYPKFAIKVLDVFKSGGQEALKQQWGLDKDLSLKILKDGEKFKQAKDKYEIRQIMLSDCGGLKMIYRGNLENCSAAKTNPQEVLRSKAEGVEIIENTNITKITANAKGRIESVKLSCGRSIAASTLLVAIGNDAAESDEDDDKISYIGDANPLYRGSIVQALASSKKSCAMLNQKLKS